MTTRDEIIKLIDASYECWLPDMLNPPPTESTELADRILALLPPREPTEVMVEAMALSRHGEYWEQLPEMTQRHYRRQERAAWAAGYATWDVSSDRSRSSPPSRD